MKANGLATDLQLRELQQNCKKQKELQNKLTRLQNVAKNVKALQVRKKEQIEELKKKHPELSEELNTTFRENAGAGRPRLEVEKPLLLQAIVELVLPDAGAEEKRRSEQLRSCRTLDQLQDALKQKGEWLLSKESTAP